MTTAILLATALLVGAPKAPPPAPSRCDGESLRVELVFGDLVADVAGLRLLDPPVPEATSAPQPSPSPAVAEDRSFVGPPAPPVPVLAGALGDSGGYELRLSSEWWLARRDDWQRLSRPRTVNKDEQPRVLGTAPGVHWLLFPGSVSRVDAAAGVMKTGSITRDSRPWHILRADTELWIIAGERLIACDAGARCRDLVYFPVSVARVVHGASGWLVNGGTSSSGRVYRVPRDEPQRYQQVLTAPVATLCQIERGVGWLYSVEADGTWALARATTESTTLAPVSRRDALLAALTTPASPQLLDPLVATAMRELWPELELVALLLASDTRPIVRGVAPRALATLPTTRSFATLWLLGRDLEPDVRLAALDGTAVWCSRQRPVPCASALKQYIEDKASEVSWQARDLLLPHDPWTALRGAPPAYRLDAVSSLTSLVLRSSSADLREALRRLAIDPDPLVRSAAASAVSGMGL